MALDAADLQVIFLVQVVKKVELAIGGEFGVQKQAQQPAFGSQAGRVIQRRRRGHAELEHRFRDNCTCLNQAHATGSFGHQQITGRKNRQPPRDFETVRYHLDMQLHLARLARVALHHPARCGFSRYRHRCR